MVDGPALESGSFQAEQCHENSVKWSNQIIAGIITENSENGDSVLDPSENRNKIDPDPPPDTLAAFQALRHNPGDQGVDYRPHIWDNKTKSWTLLDSGSMISCVPPDPGDQPVQNKFLRAVNGSKIKYFGEKHMEYKGGGKTGMKVR